MIEIRNVSKTFNGEKHPAVKNVSITANDGELLVFLGSSGSGKTTLLKMINRLITPSSGDIIIDSRNVKKIKLTTQRRQIGYVFQQIGLFPHMTVQKNITILLKLLGQPQTQRIKRANKLLELVKLDPKKYGSRYPDELSGGQQQRVGVARALAADPKYLLMDEPFGALDAMTRNSLQDQIIQLIQQLQKTIIFVTHDIFEAFRLADRIAIMHLGVLEQVGTKEEIIKDPRTPFVAELIAQPKQQIEDLAKADE